jgi:hypothetical protein
MTNKHKCESQELKEIKDVLSENMISKKQLIFVCDSLANANDELQIKLEESFKKFLKLLEFVRKQATLETNFYTHYFFDDIKENAREILSEIGEL